MTSAVTTSRPAHVAAVPGDPFDLEILVVESSQLVGTVATSDGGCQATCGSGACTSSGA
ncbi:FxLD family lanthipeptide [Streptomyces pseudovenezuelae]|uniref:FxLD family lanthipeptide n=1 Tax=Streptomyces pseudovenezuelae TaxID=67350 RepID=UPI0036EDECE1